MCPLTLYQPNVTPFMPHYPPQLKRFYINEEQSLYLLSHQDARKIKDWIQLCQDQLSLLGFDDIELIGKGAFGFVFGGKGSNGNAYVFKFSRINLPQSVQDRLEEEAWMQSRIEHLHIPKVYEYRKISKQSAIVMDRAQGVDLDLYSIRHGRLSPKALIDIAAQMAELLQCLRQHKEKGEEKPLVHGDIKPSNLVYDPESGRVQLIDWGSSVYAQIDATGHAVSRSGVGLIDADMEQTNAKLGDVYFIGDEQLNGGLSSPRFDEQGTAATLYALASCQSCRYGYQAIPATSLGLPQEFARILQTMLAGNPKERREAGDYFLKRMPQLKRLVLPDLQEEEEKPLVPTWIHSDNTGIDTVVYSSRTHFLREENPDPDLAGINDVELAKYYKNFMHTMGDTERAFLAAISRLGKYPIVGGLALHWDESGVSIDSSLNLHDERLQRAFIQSVNVIVNLARSIQRVGVFKCCMFDARMTLHIDRENEEAEFVASPSMRIPYEVHHTPNLDDKSRLHSYFEDGDDPDESLDLPASIMNEIETLNDIRHTGLVIFESFPTHLKIHSYYVLLDESREAEFAACLQNIIGNISEIKGLGVSGFMKLPYKNTRLFNYQSSLPERFYPKNPKASSQGDDAGK